MGYNTAMNTLIDQYITLKRESLLPCELGEYVVTDKAIERVYPDGSKDIILSLQNKYLAELVLRARINKFLDDKKKKQIQDGNKNDDYRMESRLPEVANAQ